MLSAANKPFMLSVGLLNVVMLNVAVPLKQLVLNTSAYFSGASEEKEMFCNIATGPVSFRISPIHV